MLHIDDGDRVFLATFEALELAAEAFRHREHIRLAWLVRRLEAGAAARLRIARGIRAFADAHGASAKYHVTITEAWIRLVEDALASDAPGDVETFDGWIARHPALLDASLLARHFSNERLRSEPARFGWVEPDLAPLPPPATR
jgi:hypothetical protein